MDAEIPDAAHIGGSVRVASDKRADHAT